jgi:hypothetical protein
LTPRSKNVFAIFFFGILQNNPNEFKKRRGGKGRFLASSKKEGKKGRVRDAREVPAVHLNLISAEVRVLY